MLLFFAVLMALLLKGKSARENSCLEKVQKKCAKTIDKNKDMV